MSDKERSDRPTAAAERLIRRLAEGNPLLDDDAYEKARTACKSNEERDLLRALRDAARTAIANHGTGPLRKR